VVCGGPFFLVGFASCFFQPGLVAPLAAFRTDGGRLSNADVVFLQPTPVRFWGLSNSSEQIRRPFPGKLSFSSSRGKNSPSMFRAINFLPSGLPRAAFFFFPLFFPRPYYRGRAVFWLAKFPVFSACIRRWPISAEFRVGSAHVSGGARHLSLFLSLRAGSAGSLGSPLS